MIEPCPCYKCPERFTACSDRCPKDLRGAYGYKAWTEQRLAQQKELKDANNRWSIPGSAARDKFRYSYKRRRSFNEQQNRW